MQDNYTHISILIDRSGSMANIWDDAVGGVENLIRDNKKLSEKCTLSLSVFDSVYDEIFKFRDLQLVPECPLSEIAPRGSTALLDALGRMINDTGVVLKNLKEEDRPSKIVVFVQTDGHENWSKEFSKAKIKEMISRQRDTYNWEFIFLGAGEDAIANQAQDFGIYGATTASFSHAKTSDVYASVSDKLMSYRGMTCNSANAKEVLTFSAVEKAAFKDE
jgi:hypothetical protein